MLDINTPGQIRDTSNWQVLSKLDNLKCKKCKLNLSGFKLPKMGVWMTYINNNISTSYTYAIKIVYIICPSNIFEKKKIIH